MSNSLKESIEIMQIHSAVALRCLERRDLHGVRFELRSLCLALASSLRSVGIHEVELAGTIERALFETRGRVASG